MGQDRLPTAPAENPTPLKPEGEGLPTVTRSAIRRPSLLEVCGAIAIAMATAITIVLSYDAYSPLIPVLSLVFMLSLCFPFWWRYPQSAISSRFPRFTLRWLLGLLVFLIIAGSSYWEYRFMSIESGRPRYLTAAEDPYFQDDCSEKVPAGALLVYFGRSTAFIPAEIASSDSPYVLLLTANQPVLTVQRSALGLFVTAEVMSSDGQFVAKIERNKLINYSNNSGYQVRSEKSTLAIYDEHDQEVFYVRYMNSFAVKIRGIFGLQGKHVLVVTDEEMSVPALNQHIPKMCIGSISGGYRF